MIKVAVSFVAAIPYGHHVTVIPLDMRGLFSGEFSPSKQVIVCDDDTRIVYTSRGIGHADMTYDTIGFAPDSAFRVSLSLPPLRGRAVGCTVRTDSGDTVYNETTLLVEPDPPPPR